MIEAFDDAPLRGFLKAKQVHAIREYSFVSLGMRYLVALLTYGLWPVAAATDLP